MKKYRIIVAGGREFNNYKLLKERLDFYTQRLEEGTFEIVSGKARGADSLGERWAKQNIVPICGHPAAWDTYGKSAGYRRNAEMAEYATHLVAFWDGVSRGTKSMIDLAKEKRLIVRVVRYK